MKKLLISTLCLFTAIGLSGQTQEKGVELNGLIWATRNVDAPGTFAATPESYGMYYQFNRATGWSSSDPMTPSPAGAAFEAKNYAGGGDWSPENSPCPTGWRMPTYDELGMLTMLNYRLVQQGERYGLEVTDGRNTLFLPAAGSRYFEGGGVLSNQKKSGNYWSSNPQNAGNGNNLSFNEEYLFPVRSDKNVWGFSVRCVKDITHGARD